jgi:tRNA1(Val) A37 N6-methylase TrmN6
MLPTNSTQEELERLDIFHKFFLMAQDGALFSAPLDTRANLRILDLGTGTGIWPIDVSKYVLSLSKKKSAFERHET